MVERERGEREKGVLKASSPSRIRREDPGINGGRRVGPSGSEGPKSIRDQGPR